jgi:hypothetical protein
MTADPRDHETAQLRWRRARVSPGIEDRQLMGKRAVARAKWRSRDRDEAAVRPKVH